LGQKKEGGKKNWAKGAKNNPFLVLFLEGRKKNQKLGKKLLCPKALVGSTTLFRNKNRNNRIRARPYRASNIQQKIRIQKR
jgi:hypothetical protein